MKKCLVCQMVHEIALERCPACGTEPLRSGEFTLYAPEMAVVGGGFQAVHFAELARSEESNFWFRARNRLILWALRTYCLDFESILEVGCGTGYVLSGIASIFPNVRLYGSEIFLEGLPYARARQPTARFIQMDARVIPFVDEFDVIGAFDVLEHIEEDDRVLAQMYAALTPGGKLLLTVPQHKWLWSSLDDSARHVRRYSVTDLHRKVEAAGFRICRSSSFVSVLLPFMLLSRVMVRLRSVKHDHELPELEINPWLNRFFEFVMVLEELLIRIGMSLPLGGSRLVVARKP